jgi:hypothetical protein
MNPFCAWMVIEWSLIKFVFFVMIWNPRWPPPQSQLGFRISIKNPNFLEDLQMIIPGQFGFNCPSGLRKEAFWNIFPQVIVLTQDHMGKYRNVFFSEAIALIEPKLCINHWKVLYKLCVFWRTIHLKYDKLAASRGLINYILPNGAQTCHIIYTAIKC